VDGLNGAMRLRLIAPYGLRALTIAGGVARPSVFREGLLEAAEIPRLGMVAVIAVE
jgi:hypothetical protein